MALTDMVMMPGADYLAICDKVREKTGTTDAIKSSEIPALLGSIGTTLPALTNPAGAEHIVEGYEAIDGDGKVITGSHVCKQGIAEVSLTTYGDSYCDGTDTGVEVDYEVRKFIGYLIDYPVIVFCLGKKGMGQAGTHKVCFTNLCNTSYTIPEGTYAMIITHLIA